MSFTICLNTSTIRPATLSEKIRIASICGYQAIELWCDDVEKALLTGETLRSLRQRIDDAGLQAVSMIALFDWMDSKEGPEKKAGFAACQRKMELAAAMGAPRIVASPVPDTDSLDIPRSADRYRELLEIGDSMGVSPAMEFLGFFHNVYRLDQALKIALATEHPAATIVLDPFHIYRGGSSFAEIAQIPMDRVGICHFNDAPATPARELQTDADRVYPGDGILPLIQMIKDLQAGNYQGAISVELFNPTYWGQNLQDVARTGLEKTIAILEAAST